jgi:hypothetical protein
VRKMSDQPPRSPVDPLEELVRIVGDSSGAARALRLLPAPVEAFLVPPASAGMASEARPEFERRNLALAVGAACPFSQSPRVTG